MSSTPPLAPPLVSASWYVAARSALRSHWTFAALQVLDVLTTLTAFRAGGVEINPLVAHLTVYFGRMGGVLASKAIAVLIALGVRRLLWVVNLFYVGVICWNIFIIMVLAFVHHR